MLWRCWLSKQELHDPAVPGYPFGEVRPSLLQAVQRLSDNLEFSFDRGLGQRAAGIGTNIHTFNEVLDIRTCLVDIHQQDTWVGARSQGREIDRWPRGGTDC